jgi:dUTP pyrophosphatase
MPQLEIDVEILDPRYKTGEFQMPCYKTEGSAGMDLIAAIDKPITLSPGETTLIPTGLKLAIRNPQFVGLVFPRSGLGHKKGLVLGNLTGVIDSDYEGQLMVSLWNRTPTGSVPAPPDSPDYPNWHPIGNDVVINPGDSIAQYVVVPVIQASLNVVDSLESAGQRGEGGFGSTDLLKVINTVQLNGTTTLVVLSDNSSHHVPLDFSWRLGERVEVVAPNNLKRIHPSMYQTPTIAGVYSVAVVQHDGSGREFSTLTLSPAGACQIYAPGVQLGDRIYQTTEGFCLTLDQVLASAKAGSLNVAGDLDVPELFDR